MIRLAYNPYIPATILSVPIPAWKTIPSYMLSKKSEIPPMNAPSKTAYVIMSGTGFLGRIRKRASIMTIPPNMPPIIAVKAMPISIVRAE